MKILGFETFFGAKEGIFRGACKFFDVFDAKEGIFRRIVNFLEILGFETFLALKGGF